MASSALTRGANNKLHQVENLCSVDTSTHFLALMWEDGIKLNVAVNKNTAKHPKSLYSRGGWRKKIDYDLATACTARNSGPHVNSSLQT